jgi:C-terminal processing protease CtpA/Prc
MRVIKIPLMLLMLISLSACNVFLGPEPDTSPHAVLYDLWNDFDKMHAYIDFRMSHNKKYNSWNDVYYNETNGYKRQLQNLLQRYPYGTNEMLFLLCVEMLKELNDAHVSLRTPDKPWSSIGGRGSLNIGGIREYLEDDGSLQYTNFLYGTFITKPQIGYIHIQSFTHPYSKPGEAPTWAEKINDITASLHETEAIVIDIRCNGGGDPWAMEYIAGRFAAKAKDYLIESVKNGPGRNDFSNPQSRIIKPAGTRYIKPIVLLSNGDSVSAAEWFTLALRTQDHVIHAGTITHGAFSGRVERPMANGWIYRISPYRITDTSGNCYEGVGISPDKQYINEGSDEEQLEYAMDLAYEMAGYEYE